MRPSLRDQCSYHSRHSPPRHGTSHARSQLRRRHQLLHFGSGLRSQCRRRATRFGQPGSLSAHPWFSRDALRTAASWAGMADAAVSAGLDELSPRPGRGELEGLAVGRLLTAQRTIDMWMAHAAVTMDCDSDDLPNVALHARAAISDSCHLLLDEAARACGSRPFARADALDRARRDLEVFLLQHRLDPLLARSGQAALDER